MFPRDSKMPPCFLVGSYRMTLDLILLVQDSEENGKIISNK